MTTPREGVMELLKVKQLGPRLKDSGVFDRDALDLIDQTMQAMQASGKRAAIGDVAVELGVLNQKTGQPFSKDDLARYLNEQLVDKAAAIVVDIGTIASKGPPTAEIPAWLKANWGNNGVNPAAQDPTREDGLSAAVNMAQNILMCVVHLGKTDEGEARKLAGELKPAISAAARLAEGILEGDSRTAPIATQADDYMTIMSRGLEQAVSRSGISMKSNWSDAQVSPQDYAAERFKEMKAGVNIALEAQRQQIRERE
jgi:hypothetical protein